MSTYKVRRGETTLEVEGLSGLVSLIQQGELGPDDPVFIPATGRWHYARAVRQLRDHFPAGAVTAPPPAPPPPAVEKEEGEEERRGDRPAVIHAPPANVLPLRPLRSRITGPSGASAVPVFSYDVDLDSDTRKRFRLLFLLAAGAVLIGLTWVYQAGYAAYMRDYGSRIAQATPIPIAPGPGPGPARVPVRATPVPVVAPVATPKPLYDPAEVVAKVKALRSTIPDRPDRLGPAMRADLLKLGVPVHSVVVAVHGKGSGKLPFACLIEPAFGSLSPKSVARDRYLIVAYAGDRISRTRLNLDLLQVKSVAGRKMKLVNVPLELARRASAASATEMEVDALFK